MTTAMLTVAGMGILGTLLAPLLNAWLGMRNERVKWAREERLTGYAAFLAKAMQTAHHRLHRPAGFLTLRDEAEGRDRVDTMLENIDTHWAYWGELLPAYHMVVLLGSGPVRDQAGNLLQVVQEIANLPPPDDHAEHDTKLDTYSERLAGEQIIFYEAVRSELHLQEA
jgi:hypothetical protein